MTVRLRPHHLLCLLTYVGKGYSPAFTANYDVIAGRLSRSEEILIVSGPDDICAPLADEPERHCLRDSVTERDHLAAVSLGELLARPIRASDRLTLDATLLIEMREAFSSGITRKACSACEWATLCSAIARGGYRDAVLQPPLSTGHHYIHTAPKGFRDGRIGTMRRIGYSA